MSAEQEAAEGRGQAAAGGRRQAVTDEDVGVDREKHQLPLQAVDHCLV
jgi:hypothetical protein